MKLTRLVASTMLSEKDFWSRSLLGQSLLLFPEELRPELAIRFDNTGKWGLPEVYNRALDDCPPEKYLLFVHDDVFLHDLFLQHRIAEALRERDVIGLAGSRGSDLSQPSWGLAFDSDLRPIGWQAVGALSQAARSEGLAPPGVVLSGAVSHVSRYLDPSAARSAYPSPSLSLYGNFPAACDLLDGLFLACNTALLQEWNVRFDERFRFHLYDLDFCRTARAKHLRLSTWPLLVSHGSGGNFDTEEFRTAARLYLAKWQEEAPGSRLPTTGQNGSGSKPQAPSPKPSTPPSSPPSPPHLVECNRCGSLFLKENILAHASEHDNDFVRSFEELRARAAPSEAS